MEVIIKLKEEHETIKGYIIKKSYLIPSPLRNPL